MLAAVCQRVLPAAGTAQAQGPPVMTATAVGAAAVASGVASAMSMRVAYRMASPADDGSAAGCRTCGNPFRPGVAGWLALTRRCPACREHHGPSRWIVAVVGACASATLTVKLAPTDAAGWALLWAWHVIVVAGLLLSSVDVAVHRLPTSVVVGTATGVVLAIVSAAVLRDDLRGVAYAGLGALVLGGGYLLLFVVSRGGLGAGDVRLAAVVGWVAGATSWHTLLLSAITPHLLVGPVAVGAALRAHHRGQRPAPIAFGPFLVAGAILAAVLHR